MLVSGCSVLGLGSALGCGGRSDLLGPDDSLGPADQANGGSISVGGGTPAPTLDITKCPRVTSVPNGDCESKFMCPGVTFQTVCYSNSYPDNSKRSCRCINLSNGNSALKEFNAQDEDPCFADAPSLCQP